MSDRLYKSTNQEAMLATERGWVQAAGSMVSPKAGLGK